jgi:hypothetical protein
MGMAQKWDASAPWHLSETPLASGAHIALFQGSCKAPGRRNRRGLRT